MCSIHTNTIRIYRVCWVAPPPKSLLNRIIFFFYIHRVKECFHLQNAGFSYSTRLLQNKFYDFRIIAIRFHYRKNYNDVVHFFCLL